MKIGTVRFQWRKEFSSENQKNEKKKIIFFPFFKLSLRENHQPEMRCFLFDEFDLGNVERTQSD